MSSPGSSLELQLCYLLCTVRNIYNNSLRFLLLEYFQLGYPAGFRTMSPCQFESFVELIRISGPFPPKAFFPFISYSQVPKLLTFPAL